MTRPIINPNSEKSLLSFIKELPQSLLITGENGVGLSTISRYIAEQREITPTIILPEKDEKVDLEKGVISVEIMRRLYDETRTKTASSRIIIIDYAERMTHQAQNAFLKLLEEPNEGVYFILVSHSVAKLLPTILSRVEKLEIQPVTVDQSKELLDTLQINDAQKRAQLLFMATGRPAELIRLCNDDEYFSKRSAMIRDARELLQGSLYQKLLIAQNYKDKRPDALNLLLDASNILRMSIVSNPQPEAINRIENLLKAYQRIEANGNIRLALAQMVI